MLRVRRRRALVLTAGRARGSLAAVRALSAAGWVVGVGTPDGAGFVTASRACSHVHVVPRPRGDGSAFVAGVHQAVDEQGYDVVFGGGDDWAAALATWAPALPVTVAHPAGPVVRAALDKAALAGRARRAGLSSPRTELGTAAALADWQGPVVVKCMTHWEPGQQHEHRVEARRYASAAAAAERVGLLEQAGLRAVLQEPVDGQLGALIGLVHEGRLLGRVQQVSPRLWPTPSGVSARAVTVPLDSSLVERVEQLLAQIGWSGLVEVQFLRAPGREPAVIDINGRFYGSMALANAAGPNLADAWGRQALGEPLPALFDAPPGHRFVWGAGDLRRATVERRGGLLRDVASTVAALPGATTSVWDRHDPGPTRALVRDRLRRPAPEPAPAPAQRAVHVLLQQPLRGPREDAGSRR